MWDGSKAGGGGGGGVQYKIDIPQDSKLVHKSTLCAETKHLIETSRQKLQSQTNHPIPTARMNEQKWTQAIYSNTSSSCILDQVSGDPIPKLAGPTIQE